MSLRLAWGQAIARAVDSGIDDSLVEGLLESFAAPASLLKLVDCVVAEEAIDPSRLASAVQSRAGESSFSEADWLVALERLLQFLIRENRSATISVALGYLSCSAEYLESSGSTLTFADGVDAFLAEFGFDG